jgi:hypothetical protein
MTDFVVWLLLGWAVVQSWLLERVLKREGALQKRVNILQGAVDGVSTFAALAMEKLGITKDEILKRVTEQKLGRTLTPEEAEGLARAGLDRDRGPNSRVGVCLPDTVDPRGPKGK